MRRFWAALFCAAVCVIASAAQVRLGWDPPADLAGIDTYEVGYGQATRGYTGSVSVPVGTHSATTPDLPDGTWYFGARSAALDGRVSAWSDEITTTLGTPGVQPLAQIGLWAHWANLGGGLMAVAQVGSASLSSQGSKTLAITVPTDANFVVVFGKDYGSPGAARPTIGGSNTTLIARSGSGGNVGLYYMVNPPTGAQTLSWATGFPDSYYYGVAFFSGVDTAGPIQSYGSADSGDLTGLAYSAGSLMIGAAAGYYGTVTASDNSQTQIINETGHGFGVGIKADSEDFYTTCTDYFGTIAAVLRPASGGGSVSLIPNNRPMAAIVVR